MGKEKGTGTGQDTAMRTKWKRMAKHHHKTVVEERSVFKLEETVPKGELLFTAINVEECVTKFKFDNVHGCHRSLNGGIMRVIDVIVGEKYALVCGDGDVGNGCAVDFRDSGSVVFIADCDPICALQACIEDLQEAAIESVVSETDIFVSLSGNFNIITSDHMKVDDTKPGFSLATFPV